MRISTYQPVVYSQEVRDLRTRIDETVAKIDALPQEKLTLASPGQDLRSPGAQRPHLRRLFGSSGNRGSGYRDANAAWLCGCGCRGGGRCKHRVEGRR